ncbi:beta-galactosidase [Kribbella sp. NPDC023972]|uniref:beta-galactosidase n=1 Tax=Kribbella sp. NPDC023972 TaxID=3154795 RepID=UPI0034000E19
MTIWFGGDYNPEQWPDEVWAEDARLFDLAGVNTATIGVFSWGLLQPSEDVYDFSVLDRITASLSDRNVIMATATGAHPAWLARQYPEVTRVDFEGRKHVYGARHNHCPSSPIFQRLSVELAGRIAERYADLPNLVAWHVGNEYGGSCYCDNCTAAFRVWLRNRYGTLDALNHAWCTTFWSHTFYDWDEIVAPSALSEHWRGPNHTAFQGITLDYLRFMSDALLENFKAEKTAIRQYSDAPVTTNLMGFYRPLDYFRWAEHLDVISWDNYPPDDRSAPRMALTHDLMRGLKGGQSFWLMEQTPSTTACRDVNPVKRPGVMRLWSYQALAHGSDTVLFFQLRASRGASEKYHGAVINHASRSDTRVFQEVAALGAELPRLAPLVGAETRSKVALMLDWNSWWAVEISDGPSRHVSYVRTAIAWYAAVQRLDVDVDVVPVDADISSYDVVLAPLLHMVPDGLGERLEEFVSQGGTLVTGVLSGRVDVDDNAFLTDIPGPLARVLGVRVDETDAQDPSVVNPVQLDGVTAEGSLVFDLIIPEGAEVVGTYTADFYAGTAAVTRHRFGAGQAWYLGTMLDAGGLDAVLGSVVDEAGLTGSYARIDGVEARRRYKDGQRYLFLLNHGDREVRVAADMTGTDLITGAQVEAGAKLVLPATGVVVLRSDDV